MAHVVGFVARSGTGKTTLLEKVISVLKKRGCKVGAVKSDSHKLDIDVPGKDSYRFAAAGADSVMLVSSEKLALLKKHDSIPALDKILETYLDDMDIVLVEGFKKSSMPKIEVFRKDHTGEFPRCGLVDAAALVAVVGDCYVDLGVPFFDLNDAEGVAEFIMGYFYPGRK